MLFFSTLILLKKKSVAWQRRPVSLYSKSIIGSSMRVVASYSQCLTGKIPVIWTFVIEVCPTVDCRFHASLFLFQVSGRRNGNRAEDKRVKGFGRIHCRRCSRNCQPVRIIPDTRWKLDSNRQPIDDLRSDTIRHMSNVCDLQQL